MIRPVVRISLGCPRACCVDPVGLKLIEIFPYRHLLSNRVKDAHHHLQQC